MFHRRDCLNVQTIRVHSIIIFSKVFVRPYKLQCLIQILLKVNFFGISNIVSCRHVHLRDDQFLLLKGELRSAESNSFNLNIQSKHPLKILRD